MRVFRIKSGTNRGFTLIEILVVATLIGLLSTVGMTGFQAVTRSGRDAVRKSDLEQIRSALEIFKSENQRYPADDANCNVAVSDTLVPNYIAKYPVDSKSPTYSYCYNQTSSLTYQICAHLENGGSTDLNCNGKPNSCGSNCNYQVSNP